MARPKRIDIPYCLYHVHSRTNSGDAAFRDKKDKEKFLYYLRKYFDLLSFEITPVQNRFTGSYEHQIYTDYPGIHDLENLV